MPRLIDANALMEFARNHIDGRIDCNDIARFPTIEAEPVRHGEWSRMVFTDSGKHAGYKCSECGRIAKGRQPYCHCGAKMDAKEDK